MLRDLSAVRRKKGKITPNDSVCNLEFLYGMVDFACNFGNGNNCSDYMVYSS